MMLEPRIQLGGGPDVVPVEHGLTNAMAEICTVATSGVLVLELDRPWPPVVVGEERVEVASGAGHVTPQGWELRRSECS